MTRMRMRLLNRACAAALLSAVAAPNASALYVEMLAIGDFVPTASGGCGADDRGSWPGMVQAWWDEMGARGHYKGPPGSQYRYVNGNMTLRRFCDTSFNANCQDSYPYADWGDATIVATHGWDAGDHWGGVMRYPWNGFCGVEAGGSSNQVRLGDSWNVFMHVSSCFSADDDNLDGIRNAMQDASTSGSRRAHQWDGFHGIMWISSSYNGNYRETAKDGHSVSVAYSWVTNHYKNNTQDCEWYDPFNWFGTCQDQCPIAYSIGASNADALTRLNNERYNFVYADPTSNSNYAYMYYASCNPVGETSFNP